MGLDMYAYKTREHVPPFGPEVPGDSVQIAYWRKHPNLHGWMEALYRKKGGTETFNCVSLQLSETDLDELERAVTDDLLPFTTGFFFGESHSDEKIADLAFIKVARKSLADGYSLIYSSWW